MPQTVRQRVWAIYVSAARRERDMAPVTPAPSGPTRPADVIPAAALKELRDNGLSDADLPRIIEEAAARRWAASDGCRFTGDIPIRQHPNIYPPALRHLPIANYTDEACAGRVEGIVFVELIINRDGTVREPRAIRGLPGGLDDRAVDAVRAGEWWPALLCGSPVPVHTTMTVNFELPRACR
ncbi:MAG TPA: energy transducer TonB [Gemmatimonadaceae bacterium]|nr:energy transducer TonB [Gemmatimonadaceae bacterium]